MREALLAVARGERVSVNDDLVRAAAAEGMLGLLARAAANPHRELQMKAAAIEAHGAFMLNELTRIAAAFRDASVPLLAFKGPVLSQQLYGHPGLRSFSDLDVIASDADAAESLIRNLGYRELQPISPAERRTNRRFAGEELFTNDGNGVLLDFHTLFANRQFPVHLDFQDVWYRRTEVAGIPAFGDVDLAILTCNHAAKHLWHKLEYLAQIAALARMPVDWREVEKRAKEARVWKQVAFSFALARDILGIDTAFDADISRIKAIVGKAHDATGTDHFVLLDRKRDALCSIAQSIFVPTHDDYRAPLPWLFRPLRLATRLFSSRR